MKNDINTKVHVRAQLSVDTGTPPLSYTSSEPISNMFTFLGSLEQMIISGSLKRRFQKYVTLIKIINFNNIIIRSRVMAETPKLKKTVFWYFDHKGINFQYFQKPEKSSILYSFIPFL